MKKYYSESFIPDLKVFRRLVFLTFLNFGIMAELRQKTKNQVLRL